MSPEVGILPRLRSAARRLLGRPLEGLRPARQATVIALRILLSTLRKLRRDRAAQMAAALAFQTLISLLPLLALAMVVLHAFRGLEGEGAALRNMIVDFLVPESLVEPGADLPGPFPAGEPATLDEFDQARQLVRGRVDQLIEQLSQVSFAGVGIVGLLLFLYGSTSLTRTVENSFDLLWQAESPAVWSRLLLHFTLLILGPLAMVGAHVLQNRVFDELGTFTVGWIASLFAWIAPLVVTTLLLWLAFHSLPNAWVSWRASGLGALWSGIALYAFQEFFGAYVNRASLTSLYGALALLPLFLLWIYWSWLLVLAGVALSFVAQYVDTDEIWASVPVLPGDPRWLVTIMARVALASTRAERITTVRLSRELRLSPQVLRPYVRLLEEAKLVRELRLRDGEHVLTLARPAAAITVKEILALAPPAGATVAAGLLTDLHRGELEAAAQLTLEDVTRREGGATARPRPAAAEQEPAPVPAVEA